jgi:hypothetical protein
MKIADVMREVLYHKRNNERLLDEWTERADAARATCPRIYHESDAFRDIEARLSSEAMGDIISGLMQVIAGMENEQQRTLKLKEE